MISAAGSPGPVATVVESRPGLDATGMVLRATDGRRRMVFVAPGLTNRENLQGFREAGAHLVQDPVTGAGGEFQSWTQAFDGVFEAAPVSVMVVGPRSLAQAHKRFWAELGASWVAVRRGGARVHLYLVDDQRGLGAELGAEDSPLRDPAEGLRPGPAEAPVNVVRVDPGSHYDLAAAVPGWRGVELLKAWALLGGNPRHWAGVEAGQSPEETARALHLEGRAGAESPDLTLARYTQAPHRYASILRAIATGATSRSEASKAVRLDSTTRSAAGPYLQRIEELGLVAVERPLGSDPGGRRSRYRLTDPADTFSWSRVHGLRSRAAAATDPASLWTRYVEPYADRHLAACLPQIVRAFLEHRSSVALGSPVREVGPLWGEGYDFPVAATLRNGAVCYAHIHTEAGPVGSEALDTLEGQMREVRYGFGRQARLRLLVSVSGFTDELRREAARRDLVRLLGPEELTAG